MTTRSIPYSEIERLYMALLRSVHQSRLPGNAKIQRYIEVNACLDYTSDAAKWQRLLSVAVSLAYQLADVTP